MHCIIKVLGVKHKLKDVSELNWIVILKVRIGIMNIMFLQVGIFYLSKHLYIRLQTLLSSVSKL